MTDEERAKAHEISTGELTRRAKANIAFDKRGGNIFHRLAVQVGRVPSTYKPCGNPHWVSSGNGDKE